MNHLPDSSLRAQPVSSNELHSLEQLIQGQRQIIEMITAGKELSEILEVIALWTQQETREEILVSVSLLDEKGERLLHGAAPSLPEAYNKAIDGIHTGPDSGSFGAAAYAGQMVIAEHIETDPVWASYKELALQFNLKASTSLPLIGKQGKVLGTFTMYYKVPQTPAAYDLQIVRLISSITVLAIESRKAEQQRQALLESERKAYLRIKEERQNFYNLLMQTPALVAFLKGPDHVFELANDLYFKGAGRTADIIGKPVREVLPELEHQGFIQLLDTVYKTGEPFYGTEVLVKVNKENGQVDDLYLNFVYQPVKNKENLSEGIFFHGVDVTELVRAKQRAEKSEEMFRSFVLNSPMPIGIYLGREMRIQTANTAILKAWEKDESVIGKTFREALPELEGQPFYQLLDNVYTTGIAYQAAEDRVDLYRNGKLTPTYWNFTYKALKNEKGEIYGVINTAVEVTELVTAKQKLAEAQDTLRSAIDIGELGTWTIDIINNFVTYSGYIVDWFGLPPEGASLEAVINRMHADDREKVRQAVEKALATDGLYEAEYKVINPYTHRERILHAKGKVVLDEKGRQVVMNGVCRDITLYRETEKELAKEVEKRTFELKQANIELNTLNENLKQFVYVASHDLQEPLRKINIFSEMLKMKLADKLDEDTHKYFSKIIQARGRMANLIKDLLDFSRAESADEKFVETDLNQVLQFVVEDFEILIQQKNARIIFSHLPVIVAIPLQMNQLFYNLIGNALKFSKDGIAPEVVISSNLLPHTEILQYAELNTRWQYVEIIIKDNGIGFDQRFAEKIFIIFQRLHGKEEFEGTGIGLALCKKIADNHNGMIFAKGKVNEGAAFHIILPVNRV